MADIAARTCTGESWKCGAWEASSRRDPERSLSRVRTGSHRIAASSLSNVPARLEEELTLTTPEPPPAVPQPSSVPGPLADWGTRAIGFVIDYLPIIILNALTVWSSGLRYFAGLIGLGYWIYMGYLDGVSGQTPGKAMQGIRLVSAQGSLIGAGGGIGRKFLHILDAICLIGFLLPIVDAQRQTFADKLMATYVVTGAEKQPFAIELWTSPPQQRSQ